MGIACAVAANVIVGCAPVKIPAGPPVEEPKMELPAASARRLPAQESAAQTASLSMAALPGLESSAPPPTAAEPPLAKKATDPATDPVLGTLIAADGAELPMRAWLPVDPAERAKPKAIVLGVHGFNDYSNAFDMPGRWWAKHGIATYAYDQRGFGEAPHPGYWAGTNALTGDLGQAARLLAARYPGVPLYYLGESMGAAVVLTALARNAVPRPAGTILAAPAVWSRAYMPFYQRWALWAASHVTPWLRLTGRGLHIVASDNRDMLIAYSRDPLVIKATRADTIKGLVDLMDKGMKAVGKLPGPALVLIGAHDEVVPIKPQWTAVTHLPDPAHQRIAYYRNGWHMVLRDLEARTVWADIDAWIADHSAPLPSGADREADERLRDWKAYGTLKTARE
jgi:alpha-beta hydrolase superfamily lysophospholipase